MRLILAFFVLVAIPTSGLTCASAVEPSFEGMIQDSTLIVRGEVLLETSDNQWNQGQIQRWSNVLIERAYKGASSGIIRVSWKEYVTLPASSPTFLRSLTFERRHDY